MKLYKCPKCGNDFFTIKTYAKIYDIKRPDGRFETQQIRRRIKCCKCGFQTWQNKLKDKE